MMRVSLLGVPAVVADDGESRSPRGAKTWAMLGYLALADRPQTRSRLAAIFHPEAADPLGALRWTLADTRKLIGDGGEIGGDPVTVDLTAGTEVDVLSLVQVATAKEDPNTTFLAGVNIREAPLLEAWVEQERYRLAAELASFVKEFAVAALASDQTDEAVRLSQRLVDIDPLDERHHALLVRSLIAAGEADAAKRSAQTGSKLLAEELGSSQTILIDAALAIDDPQHMSSPRSVQALLDAGRAAMGAGVPDAALRTLGTALRDARHTNDAEVLVGALIAMAEALIHSVRGLDEIALELLVEAEAIAAANGDAASLAAARRELGYTALLRGDYTASDRWFAKALAVDPPLSDVAAIHTHRAATLTDRGLHEEALEAMGVAVGAAKEVGDQQQLAHVLTIQGRALFHSGAVADAVPVLEESIEHAATSGWIAFQPFPSALLAQALLSTGRDDEAKDLAEGSFVLACEIGDPCWEGLSGRALALTDIDRGDLERARVRLEDAYQRATRVPDSWAWLNAYILAALCEVLLEIDPEAAPGRIDELESIAGPSEMRDLVDRAADLRADLEVAVG